MQDAEDLTSQTFMAVLKSLHTYRGQGSFLAWTLSIASRKVADFFRRRSNPVPLESARTLHDTSPTPEAAAQQTLQLERVAACLTCLATDRAEAITLRVFGGLSVPEVATIMHRSEDAVYALLSRGLRDLRQRLNGTEG